MDELIYNFLLQSEYPRSSIIFNIDVGGSAENQCSDAKTPAFIIADPETADVLAVIEVATSLNADMLKRKASEVGYCIRRLSDDYALGFLFCLNPHGLSEQEQVQVYRVMQNDTVQLLSMQNFPSFISLRISCKLAIKTLNTNNDRKLVLPEDSDDTENASHARIGESENQPGNMFHFYLPAVILLFAIVFDKLLSEHYGGSLLTTAQSVLAIGAAIGFMIPVAVRYLERVLVKRCLNELN